MVRQFAYVHGVAGILLLSGKKYKSAVIVFSLSPSYKKTATTQTLITQLRFIHKTGQKKISAQAEALMDYATLFRSGWAVKPDQIKLGFTKPNKSPTWRLVQSPTSTAILQNTILHPCNSSPYPQTRKPTETAHSFSFSIVTPLINMSTGFLDPQIFSSITSLSSTR